MYLSTYPHHPPVVSKTPDINHRIPLAFFRCPARGDDSLDLDQEKRLGQWFVVLNVAMADVCPSKDSNYATLSSGRSLKLTSYAEKEEDCVG